MLLTAHIMPDQMVWQKELSEAKELLKKSITREELYYALTAGVAQHTKRRRLQSPSQLTNRLMNVASSTSRALPTIGSAT